MRKIGEGGMGVVYEAEQQHPKRAVALKVIRGGAYVDEQTVRLFHREAQALARLKHPGIAAIYESGRTEDGQHFFAMELVRGETLGAYVRKRQGAVAPAGEQPRLTPLELRERLALFRKVCDAVSYAHQRGVIHRDLKPSNILVQREAPGRAAGGGAEATSFSATVPDIKVLDFGLARITDSDVAMSTILTEAGRVQGTLPYMSPEQVRGHADEIDLRSDVYSLGVILYELISGRLPLEVLKVALPEAMRVICEEPPQPLTRTFSGTKKLDADLGTIVAKALEKEPGRRYQSAAALAEDLQRYLTDQPILARPPSALYQFRKLVARHKAAFGFIAALFVLLLGFAVTMTLQAGRIARERDRANVERDRANREAETAKTVSEFLVGLFQVVDPGEARGRTITAREILDKGTDQITSSLADQPLIQARLMDTMGMVYRNLGLYEHSGRLLEQALEIRRNKLDKDHPDLASSLSHLASVRWEQARYAESQSMLEQALAIREKILGRDHVETALTLYALGTHSMAKADYEGAIVYYQRALPIFEAKLGPDHQEVSWCLNDLGRIQAELHGYDSARGYFERALKIKEKNLAPDHPDVATGLNALGYNLVMQGKYAEAEPLLRRAVAITGASLGPGHPDLANVLQSLGELLRRTGQFAEARRVLERALAITEAGGQLEPWPTGDVLDTLARLAGDTGHLSEAESFYRRALPAKEKVYGPAHPSVSDTLTGLADVLHKTGRDEEANRLEERARDIRAQHGVKTPM